MEKGRKTDKRSRLAGERFQLAVNIFTSSYEAVIAMPRWGHFVCYDDLKQIRRWATLGLPLKRVDQVAAFFGLEAQAFIDPRVDENDLTGALYRLKQKVIDAGKKTIVLKRIDPPPAFSYPGGFVPTELGGTFKAFMADRLQGFCGRRFVFDAVDEFIKNNGDGNGYFLITGDPGIGKSALMAKLVSKHEYLHHFNIGLQAINTSKHFLENICAQLIGRYNLPYSSLPSNATRDGAVFNRLLIEAAGKVNPGEKLVIAIDALDEVASSGDMDANLLYLPPSLPKGVFIVATSRRLKEMPLLATNMTAFDLEANSPANREDAAVYIHSHMKEAAMREAVAGWEVDETTFIDAMVEKSEGNFMYLRHILPAVRAGEFRAGGLSHLPQGLLNYYRHHWKTMRGKDENRFDTLYQPVVCILAAVKEAVSLDQIHNFTGIDPSAIQKVIHRWWEFLQTETRQEAGTILYRVYHTLFQEFLYQEVEPGLKPYHRMIAEYYLGMIDMAADEDPGSE